MKLSQLATFALTLAAANAVYAQNLTLKANVPFKFVVAGQTVPAGRYTIDELHGARAIVIRKDDAKAAVLATPGAVEQRGAGGPTQLVFHRYGNRYFLAQVRVAGSYDCTFAPGRIERELSARTHDPGKIVPVLAD